MRSLIEQGLQFVEGCLARDAPECADDFRATTRLFGFAASACGAWAGIGAGRKNRFFFLDWPQDWIEFYEKNQFFQHDLLAIEARRRTTPFWYSGIVSHFKLSEKQEKLHNGFVTYGWNDALAIPIHGPNSVQGLVTMATRKALALTAKDCAVLEMMARTVWERCRTSENFGMFDPGPVRLTPREIECLQWAAAGKSDTDIAVLIGTKPTTVHFHIERAKKRLGVRTRVEAVAVGVLHGVV